MRPNRGFGFRRSALARSIAEGLTGEGLADYSSGLFLAAPRRTGKSTFLREDLIPECLARGWLPVYVDLWANRETDPALLISGAIAQALVPFEGRLRKLVKSMGVDRLSILRTLSWDFSKPQLPEGATLAHALGLLHQASGQLVVLVIDEAQHALTTEAGINAMFGLKAARDELNQGQDGDGLRLVFTGSSRDKLAHLVLNTKQPFYGSSVPPFPLLGDDFTRAYTEHLNAHLAEGNQFDPGDVAEAFQLVGCRPELLRTIIAEVSLELGAAKDLGELLRNGAELVRAGVWSEFESSYNALTLPQRAVLEVMASCSVANQPFTPFSEATVQAVGQLLKAWGSEAQASTTTIQAAIESLRDKELVWRASRGAYALEDKSMAEWLQHHRKGGEGAEAHRSA